jgi:biotin synthase
MIADAGFEVEGAGTTTLPAHRAAAESLCGAGCGHGSPAAAARTPAPAACTARRQPP